MCRPPPHKDYHVEECGSTPEEQRVQVVRAARRMRATHALIFTVGLELNLITASFDDRIAAHDRPLFVLYHGLTARKALQVR